LTDCFGAALDKFKEADRPLGGKTCRYAESIWGYYKRRYANK